MGSTSRTLDTHECGCARHPLHENRLALHRPTAAPVERRGKRRRHSSVRNRVGVPSSDSTDKVDVDMGKFGDTIQSLVDTYSNCLALLKALRGAEQRRDKRRGNPLQSSLGSQIRSDRARVRSAYSSRLSRRGASFERGDG